MCLAVLPAAAAEPSLRLDLPVLCELGRTCMVQQYVDVDPGPGAVDHACGSLTYDGHTGTDIRVPNRAAMAAGVPVVAAAAGQVRGVRDGMADVDARIAGMDSVKDRKCGNGVAITHQAGWETQYCHLRRGSVAVRPGDLVTAGQRLGLIGMSGAAQFPHVELIVRHGSTVIDPFTGTAAEGNCGDETESLWRPAAAEALAYRAGGLLATGFTDRAPSLALVDEGLPTPASLSPSAPALVFWSHIYGLREGDVEELAIIGPDGQALVEHANEPAGKNRAISFRYAGKRRPTGGWPAGRYKGLYRLTRGGETVFKGERDVEVR